MAKPTKANSKATATPTITNKSNPSSPPEPFSEPPTRLKTFLHTLNPKHVYITHIDRHPASFKRKIFMVPIAMNIAMVVGLIYRAISIAPYYAYLLMTIWGYDTPYFVDVKQMPVSGLIDETFRRMLVMVFDVTLATFIAPWPYDFFLGSPQNPTSWRMSIGFKDAEVAVRRSRRWDEQLPKDWLAEEADSAPYSQRIMPAINRQWVQVKTAYMMMDKSWDLDFAAMIKAHDLIGNNKNSLDDFEKQVIVHHAEFGWLVWPVWKLDEGAQHEGRAKIVEFKDKLTAMGKENLFFRWIEVIQHESDQPGGFTPERQANAMKEARRLFEEQEVDFDQFWEEIGGREGMPGLESQS